MKLIKPLLIYIIWIAFVWLCIAYIASDYQLNFNQPGPRLARVSLGGILGFMVTDILYLLIIERWK